MIQLAPLVLYWRLVCRVGINLVRLAATHPRDIERPQVTIKQLLAHTDDALETRRIETRSSVDETPM